MAEYSADQLAGMFRLHTATLHFYVRKKLLPAPVFRGAKTRYDELHFERLRAIRHLLHVERISMVETRKRLASLDPDAIRKIGAPPPPVVVEREEALGLGQEASWKRKGLLPGLELHVSSAASSFVKRIASEILEKYKTET